MVPISNLKNHKIKVTTSTIYVYVPRNTGGDPRAWGTMSVFWRVNFLLLFFFYTVSVNNLFLVILFSATICCVNALLDNLVAYF